jgi:hypothetical protein
VPGHAAAQQEPEPIVVEVAETMAGPARLLDEKVHGLGEVRSTDRWCDRRAPPCSQEEPSSGHRRDLDLGGSLVENEKLPAGSKHVAGGVHAAEELLGGPCSGDSSKRSPAARPAGGVGDT